MNEFLKFFDDKTKDFPMHLEIAYSKICDWNILIYKKGCADDYPKARCNGEDVIIVDESDCDMELCFYGFNKYHYEDDAYYGNVDINYCPMCGRKLVEE